MRPAKKYVAEMLNGLVNDTFEKCLVHSQHFPEQKNRIRSIASKATQFQQRVMTEVNEVLDRRNDGYDRFFTDLNLRIEQKRISINRELDDIVS